MSDPVKHRLERARYSLEGLSVGDALGDRFFIHPDVALPLISARALPAPPWRFSDDTQMALSVMACLERYGEIDQDYLAHAFALWTSGSGNYAVVGPVFKYPGQRPEYL